MKKLLLVFIGFISFTTIKGQSFALAKQFDDGLESIITDSLKNIYTVVYFSGTKDFDPNAGVYNLTAAGDHDFCIVKLDSLGNFIWAKQIKSTGTGKVDPSTILFDNQNNIYVSGGYTLTADFDPGSGISNLTSNGGSDIFILKLDPAGNFIWVKGIGGTGNESLLRNGIAIHGNGIYYTATFLGTVDANPNAGVVNLLSGAGDNMFVSKLDLAGNFIWAKNIGGSNMVLESKICVDSMDNIYTSGTFFGIVDFDPGTATYNLGASSTSSSDFICRLDPSGNFVWAKAFDATGSSFMGNILFDPAGFLYFTGWYNGTILFQSAAGPLPETAGNDFSFFIAKADINGELSWVKNFNSDTITIEKIALDHLGYIYATGMFRNIADFDPTTGINNHTSVAGDDVFLIKLNSAGNFIWGIQYGGTLQDSPYDIYISSDYSIYLSGSFMSDSVDVDPSSAVLNLSAGGYMMKLTQDICDNFAIFPDSVANVGCTGLGFIRVNTENGQFPYSYSWDNAPVITDSFSNFTTSGIHQVIVNDANNCTKRTSILLDAQTDTATSGFDLQANIALNNFRQAIPTFIYINAFNSTCFPVSGQLKLSLNPVLIYNGAIPAPDSIYNNQLMWNFNNLTYDSGRLTPYVVVTPSIGTPDDYFACSTLEITPYTGDQDTINNFINFCGEVTNSHDPNIKSVYPTGLCTPGYISSQQQLTYTVLFQNTGTADAINIYVLDTVDTNLDINSVRIVGNSDPLITEVLPGNVLKFRFDNIHLPDSTSNEEASHGYVIYQIKPTASLANGTQIKNTAGIYFDYNPPVYTNSVLNTISDGTFDNSSNTSGSTITAHLSGASYQWINCADSSLIIGATNQNFTPIQNGNYAVIISDGCTTDTSSCTAVVTLSIHENMLNSISVYPNPATSSITVTVQKPTVVCIVNMLGETVISRQVQKETNIDISALDKGIYLVQTQEGVVKKLIRQ